MPKQSIAIYRSISKPGRRSLVIFYMYKGLPNQRLTPYIDVHFFSGSGYFFRDRKTVSVGYFYVTIRKFLTIKKSALLSFLL